MSDADGGGDGGGRDGNRDRDGDRDRDRDGRDGGDGGRNDVLITGNEEDIPMLSASEEPETPPLRGESRGRKNNDSLPPSRAREVQRAFRARRAAHLAKLEDRVLELEAENAELRRKLDLPPVPGQGRYELGSGPTGKGKSLKEGGVPMSERVKAKKERDRKKGITRSPDRGELDTRSKVEKLIRLTATSEEIPDGTGGTPRGGRATSSIAALSPTTTSESPSIDNFNSLFLPLSAQAMAQATFPTLTGPGGTNVSNQQAAAAAAAVASAGMPSSMSLHFPDPNTPSMNGGGGGGGSNQQSSNSQSPYAFNPPPINPFTAYNNTLMSLGAPLFNPSVDPNTSSTSTSTLNEHQNQNSFNDSTMSHLMLLLAQNPEFQAKMLQAQQQAVASAATAAAAAMAQQQQQQQQQQRHHHHHHHQQHSQQHHQQSQQHIHQQHPQSHGTSNPGSGGQTPNIGSMMNLGGGGDMNLLGNFPDFGGLFNGLQTSTGFGTLSNSHNQQIDVTGWSDAFSAFGSNDVDTSANTNTNTNTNTNANPNPNPNPPPNVDRSNHQQQQQHTNHQNILSRSFPDGQTPVGLSRGPDKQFTGVDVRLRPPQFLAGSGDDATEDAVVSGIGETRQSSRIASMIKPTSSTPLDSPASSSTPSTTTTSHKRSGPTLLHPPAGKVARREEIRPSPSSSSSTLAQAAVTPTGNIEISLLDRLKNCCRISDVSSSDSGLMVFASRLCLAVPCNYAGLHDHDGQVASGFLSVEAAFLEIRSRQSKNMDNNQSSSVYLTMGRTAAEKVLQAVKREMNESMQDGAAAGEDGNVRGRRVGDWIGCKPATGFGISDALLRKMLQEM